MNVIIHYPKNPKNLSSLYKKAAVVHADAILQYIRQIPCSKEQKLEIIEKLKKKGLQ